MVTINGVRFKAVDNVLLDKQARSFDTLQAQVDSFKLQLQAADNQIADKVAEAKALTEKVSLVEQERDRVRGDLIEAKGLIAQQRTMLDQEIAFRHEAVQMIPKGNAHGFWGRTLDLLNSQQAQIGFKLIIPTVTMLRPCR